MNLSIKQLDYLLEIAKYNNISQAANELKISQPALSTSLKKIEKEVGISLFNRGAGGLTLNHAGQTLIPKVRKLIAGYSKVVQAAQDLDHFSPEIQVIHIPSSPWTLPIKLSLIQDPAIKVTTHPFSPTSEDPFPPECNYSIVSHYGSAPISHDHEIHSLKLIEGVCCASSGFHKSPPHPEMDSKILMPAEDLIRGFNLMIESEYAHSAEQKHSFDNLVATCQNQNTYGILPGNAKIWKSVYGNGLNFTNLSSYDHIQLTVSLITKKNPSPTFLEKLKNLATSN